MDQQFINNVPDVLSWGEFQSRNFIEPRQYKRHTLTITMDADDENYQDIINELAADVRWKNK